MLRAQVVVTLLFLTCVFYIGFFERGYFSRPTIDSNARGPLVFAFETVGPFYEFPKYLAQIPNAARKSGVECLAIVIELSKDINDLRDSGSYMVGCVISSLGSSTAAPFKYIDFRQRPYFSVRLRGHGDYVRGETLRLAQEKVSNEKIKTVGRSLQIYSPTTPYSSDLTHLFEVE